ncbi:retrovirus-related pol polyprotein from transposon TNT 1-94 [Tanacetum coccineum]
MTILMWIFLVGKDPSFPVVQQYVSNTWRKFGFEKLTRNDEGVYLFNFASKLGMDQVLEKGSWLILRLLFEEGGLLCISGKGGDGLYKEMLEMSIMEALYIVLIVKFWHETNISSNPRLKKWDCINESDIDDDDVIPLYGSFLGGGNQLEDEDFDFYDGYEDSG